MVILNDIYWGESAPVAKYDQHKFAEFAALSPRELEQECRDQHGRLKHIIRAEHFDLDFLRTICETADAARSVAKMEDKFMKSLLTAKSVLNYFKQPSSRTFLSFSMAEAHLGMRREEVRDLKTSSEVKGESEKDSLRTASSYFDAIVCRHPSDIYDLFAVWVMKSSNRELPFVNAGSGKSEHPTQAALDYYTDWRWFNGDLDNKVFAYVGDCKRGRTIHSGAKLMALHKDTTIYFVAPEELQIDPETERYLQERDAKVIKETNGLASVVPLAHKIYMTRIQDEHGGKAEYDPNFIFRKEFLATMRPDAILEHPMPKREEIDPAIDYIKDDPRIKHWEEQRNGMWGRVALLAYLFDADADIRCRYEKIKSIGAGLRDN